MLAGTGTRGTFHRPPSIRLLPRFGTGGPSSQRDLDLRWRTGGRVPPSGCRFHLLYAGTHKQGVPLCLASSRVRRVGHQDRHTSLAVEVTTSNAGSPIPLVHFMLGSRQDLLQENAYSMVGWSAQQGSTGFSSIEWKNNILFHQMEEPIPAGASLIVGTGYMRGSWG